MNSLKLALVFLVFVSSSLFAQEDSTKSGRALFNERCFACHRFDKNHIGPSLEGVSQKHDATWLRAWLKESNELTCPTNLDTKQIDSIIAFIDRFPTKKTVFRQLDERQIKGKKLFKANCAACHKLDKKLIGPPLKGITNKREREWLHAFIKDNQALRAHGDSLAIQVYEAYNKMPMLTYPNLSEEDIDNILAYLKEEEVNDKTGKE